MLEAVVLGCVAWHALEAAAYWLHHKSEEVHRRHLALLSVRLAHAFAATLLSLRVLWKEGLGMDGAFDRAPCHAVPTADSVVQVSLAWGLWELWAVCRDLEQQGLLMLIHAVVLVGSQSLVLGLGYMRHFMASMLLTEVTEVFFSLRMIGLEAHGPPFRATAADHFLRRTFIGSFAIMRFAWAGSRTVVHLSAIADGLMEGCVVQMNSLRCDSCTSLVADATGTVVQTALNMWWGAQITHKVWRGRIRSKARQKEV
jgi:hypothetical protein